MGVDYDYRPPPPAQQHERLAALRLLISRGIPCILWAEDALCYGHSVPTCLFDQQILVPDQLLESASFILREETRYSMVARHPWDYAQRQGPNKGATPFPEGIRLQHADIPEDDPNRLYPLPGHIFLLPQSYFALDTRSSSRFLSLAPPLDMSNAGILVPKYHTFLEGLVKFILYPPTGLEIPHTTSKFKHDVFIGYLTLYRVKYDLDGPPPPVGELLAAEQDILRELRTEEARWYLGSVFRERRMVRMDEIINYRHQSSLRASGPSQADRGLCNTSTPPVFDSSRYSFRYTMSECIVECTRKLRADLAISSHMTSASRIHPPGSAHSAMARVLSTFHRLARRLV